MFPDFYIDKGVFSSPSFFRVEKTAVNIAVNDDVNDDNAEISSNESMLSWLETEAPSGVLPSSVPRDIIPVSFSQPVSAIDLFSVEEAAATPAVTARTSQTTQRTQTPAAVARTAPARENRVTPSVTPPVNRTPAPQSTQTAPTSLLPSVQILQPPSGGILGLDDLTGRSLTFRWSSSEGANAYTFTLFQITQENRKQIVRETINGNNVYTLNNLRLLSRGNFLMQVEPLNIRGGTIEQRGNIAESRFIIDVPAPEAVEIEDTGILYGN